jgi:predicted dienelactone hydrolase
MDKFKKSFNQNAYGRTRAEDIRFVLNRLETLAAENDDWAARLDLNRIGVGGIDLGALAAMLVAGQVPPDGGKSLHDPRIKALVAMSPPIRHTSQSFQEVFAPVKVPSLFITGTEDKGIVGPTTASERRIPFDAMEGTDRYLVTLREAGHRVYGGRVFSLNARNDEKFQALIVRASNCFLEAALKEDSNAQDILNNRGLRSLLGNTAFVEQQLKSSGDGAARLNLLNFQK